MPDLNRSTQPDWSNLPLGQGKSGTGVNPITAMILLTALGPMLLKGGLGGGAEEPSPRDLRLQGQNRFRDPSQIGLPPRRIGAPESAAQNILSQMAMAGKPRTTTSTSIETTPEEGLDIGSLLTILMLMGGKKDKSALPDYLPLGAELTQAPTGLQTEDLWPDEWRIAPTPPGRGRNIPIPGAGEVPGVWDEGRAYPTGSLSSLGNLISLMLGLR